MSSCSLSSSLDSFCSFLHPVLHFCLTVTLLFISLLISWFSLSVTLPFSIFAKHLSFSPPIPFSIFSQHISLSLHPILHLWDFAQQFYFSPPLSLSLSLSVSPSCSPSLPNTFQRWFLRYSSSRLTCSGRSSTISATIGASSSDSSGSSAADVLMLFKSISSSIILWTEKYQQGLSCNSMQWQDALCMISKV